MFPSFSPYPTCFILFMQLLTHPHRSVPLGIVAFKEFPTHYTGPCCSQKIWELRKNCILCRVRVKRL